MTYMSLAGQSAIIYPAPLTMIIVDRATLAPLATNANRAETRAAIQWATYALAICDAADRGAPC